jgi:putative transposase
MVEAFAKREPVAHLQGVMGLLAAGLFLVEADRQMIHYRSCRPPETELRDNLEACQGTDTHRLSPT